MAYTGTNPTAIGAATKKSHFDTLWDNVAAIWAGLVGKVAITQPATGSTLTIADGMTLTASASLDTKDVIKGDGTAGRVLRSMRLYVTDATEAAHITVTTESLWNGDENSGVGNIGKDGVLTGGKWQLDGTGSQLSMHADAITGNCVGILSAVIERTMSATAVSVAASVSSNGILMCFYNAAVGVAVDLTTLVDTGGIWVYITYVTSA